MLAFGLALANACNTAGCVTEGMLRSVQQCFCAVLWQDVCAALDEAGDGVNGCGLGPTYGWLLHVSGALHVFGVWECVRACAHGQQCY
jgi:hypothetical protein